MQSAVHENLLQLLKVQYDLHFITLGSSGSLSARIAAWTLRSETEVHDAISDLISPDGGKLSSRVFLSIALRQITPPKDEVVFDGRIFGSGLFRWLEVNPAYHFARFAFRQAPNPKPGYLHALTEIFMREAARATFSESLLESFVWMDPPLVQLEPLIIAK